ncbi:MAG: 2-isopropylmalate synthase [Deltaproteobacteria bacterium]|jgi:(R)-citramalate synthase|nr:2-isopropylmalate synthase [Deltaproteobacteria bacterium]
MKSKNNTVEIFDTTLRDGEQTQGVSFSPAEKSNIAKALLQSLCVNRIEITSANVSQRDLEGVVNITSWAKKEKFIDRVEVLGFVDHHKSVDWITGAGGRVLNLLAKGSRAHCRQQLKKSLNQHVKDIKKTIAYAHEKDVSVNIYLEDWSNGIFKSPDYVYKMMDQLLDQDIKHFMLPDTLGVLSPDEVFESLSDMIRRYPDVEFDFHPHNDYGLATANALIAIKAGIRTIHCTVNCMGERAGNASLAEVTVNLKDKMGMSLSINESQLVRISDMVASFSGKRVSDNTPIVGEDVFTQTAGIHADGDKKGALYHGTLRPERFARKRSYALGKMSGKASLEKKLEELGLHLTPKNRKKVLARVVELGDSKKRITTEDLPIIIADVLENDDYGYIRLLTCTITSGLNLESTASIHVQVHDERFTASSGGNGGYDAFIRAMKKVLTRKKISIPKLTDYETRIPKGGQTSALVDCVITWHDGEKTFKTRGVHSDQVVAAVEATMKMLNLHLHGQTSLDVK